MGADTGGMREFTARVELEERPYRRVLLLMALSRVRYVLPLMFFFMCAAFGSGDISWGVYLGTAIVLLAVITWGYAEWQVRSPAMTEIYRPVTYRFAEDGLVYSTDAGEGIVEWAGFARWRVVGDHYVLQARGGRFLLIPTSAFAPGDRHELELVLKGKISKSPRVLPSIAEDLGSQREGDPRDA